MKIAYINSVKFCKYIYVNRYHVLICDSPNSVVTLGVLTVIVKSRGG